MSKRSVEFRDTANPGLVHVTYAGADDFLELEAKARAGYRWVNPQTGQFYRDRPPGAAAFRSKPRDWLTGGYI